MNPINHTYIVVSEPEEAPWRFGGYLQILTGIMGLFQK